ncbi:hypothetical protein MMC29_008018, partial [Sticta canariensis]|nr:hypothetical protein [Sticta canariensis]
MKGSLIILSHLLRVNPVDSFSPSVLELFDTAASSQGNLKARDNDVMPQLNGAEGFLADPTPSSTGPPTSLDNQLTQSPLDVPLISSGIDQPSTSNDQSNPLEPSDSKTLALDSGDIPTLPSIPFFGGSGEMNYGPNIIQQIQQLWQHPFDVHKQPEPQCKPREIPTGDPSGTKMLAKMFAMCCGPVPKTTGPGSNNRLRRKVGFECLQYYTDQASPNPGRLKRDAIPMTRRQDGIDANGALSTVDQNDPMSVIANTLPGEEDNSRGVAMELGGTSPPKKHNSGRGGSKKADWSCTGEYERRMGGTPRVKQPPAPSVQDDMEPPPYEPWSPADEDEDDYSDLVVPNNWPDDMYWTP